jgi:hypothetical protein
MELKARFSLSLQNTHSLIHSLTQTSLIEVLLDLLLKMQRNDSLFYPSGAAFATQTLASKAESQLKPHLPKLIPKLYRYLHFSHSFTRSITEGCFLLSMCQCEDPNTTPIQRSVKP